MRTLVATLTGLMLVSATLGALTSDAYALGGCGFNGHRNSWGRCVFGGQNQNYCLRRTGHTAAYVGRGQYRCY